MSIKAVLFDLFDTLLLIEDDGSEAYYEPCLRKLHQFLIDNGISVSFNDFKHVYFEVRDRLYAEAEKNLEEPHFNVRVSQVLKQLGYNFDVSSPIVVGSSTAFGDEFMCYVRLDDNALDALLKLQAKYRLGLVSNFAIPECVWKLLNKFGLRKSFDVVLISGEINKRKPSPEVFDRALKALKVTVAEAVFVGDKLGLDIKGAKSIGMRAVLIERRPNETAAEVMPDRVIKSLKELPSILEAF